jgi:Skp family chaperone for outer membrane proteins
MAILSISEAARLAGISRNHLYKKYINEGLISVTTDNNKPCIDVSELLRVFPNAKMITDDKSQEITLDNNENTELISVLKEQLANAKEQINKAEQQIAKAENRETWLQSQIDELRQQQNKLLEDKTQKQRKKFLGIF